MKIPARLIPFDSGNLVEYREFGFYDGPEKYTEVFGVKAFQVHDRTLHHVARADTEEMAQLICDSINLAFKISQIHGEPTQKS